MCPPIIKTNESVITLFKNTLLSAAALQSKCKFVKKYYDFDSVFYEDDILEKALNHFSKDKYKFVSLDKYDVELREDGEGVKGTFEFTLIEIGV